MAFIVLCTLVVLTVGFGLFRAMRIGTVWSWRHLSRTGCGSLFRDRVSSGFGFGEDVCQVVLIVIVALHEKEAVT